MEECWEVVQELRGLVPQYWPRKDSRTKKVGTAVAAFVVDGTVEPLTMWTLVAFRSLA